MWTIPFYIARESTKKRKPKDLNSDQNRIQNPNRKQLRTIVRSIELLTASCSCSVLRSDRSIGQLIASCAGAKSSFLTVNRVVDRSHMFLSASYWSVDRDRLHHPFFCALLCIVGRPGGWLCFSLQQCSGLLQVLGMSLNSKLWTIFYNKLKNSANKILDSFLIIL